MHFRHHHYVTKYHSKSLFNGPWNLFGQKVPWNFLQSSMELFEQHLNSTRGSMEFHGIPWNFVQNQSSMEFHGTFSILPGSMEFHGIFNFPPKSSIEFHGTFFEVPWNSLNLINFIFKKIIFLNIVFGIWLMIRCYLAKISQKRYILHWFQYRYPYFEHPSVSENGTMSAKMACCLYLFAISQRRRIHHNSPELSNSRLTTSWDTWERYGRQLHCPHAMRLSGTCWLCDVKILDNHKGCQMGILNNQPNSSKWVKGCISRCVLSYYPTLKPSIGVGVGVGVSISICISISSNISISISSRSSSSSSSSSGSRSSSSRSSNNRFYFQHNKTITEIHGKYQ